MGEQMLTMKNEMFGRHSVVCDDLVETAYQTPLHTFRTFVSIFTNFTHSCLRDYYT
jgi:hypothetical protein